MANRNFSNKGNIYSMHCKPVLVDAIFTVTPSNASGITLLKGAGMIKNIFMHTSTTPSAGNPNPANGYIVVQLRDNYNHLIKAQASCVSTTSGSDVKIDNSAMTANAAYVITTLGNATTAKWVAIGVPVGITPAVGVTFIAASDGGAGNTLTSRVQVPKATGSGITNIELIGTPDLNIAPSPQSSAGIGGQLILQCLGATASGTTTLVATAPATSTIIQLTLLFDDSTVLPGNAGT